jgi:hypothetical protein
MQFERGEKELKILYPMPAESLSVSLHTEGSMTADAFAIANLANVSCT